MIVVRVCQDHGLFFFNTATRSLAELLALLAILRWHASRYQLTSIAAPSDTQPSNSYVKILLS